MELLWLLVIDDGIVHVVEYLQYTSDTVTAGLLAYLLLHLLLSALISLKGLWDFFWIYCSNYFHFSFFLHELSILPLAVDCNLATVRAVLSQGNRAKTCEFRYVKQVGNFIQKI